MRYKYFLFDWDGTLADNLLVWFTRYKEILADAGIEMDYWDIGRKMIGNVNGPIEVGIKDVEEFMGKLTQILPIIWQGKLNNGVAEVVREIKLNGGRVAVVSTSKRSWIEPALRASGLQNEVDVFLGREDVVKTKPDPEMLNLAMEVLGANKEETLMIGDHAKDILAGEAAGVDSCLYYPGRYGEFYPGHEWKHLGQTYTIGDFSELEKFIK